MCELSVARRGQTAAGVKRQSACLACCDIRIRSCTCSATFYLRTPSFRFLRAGSSWPSTVSSFSTPLGMFSRPHGAMRLWLIKPGRRAIIQSGFRSRSPAYPLLHIDALNNALEKAARPGDVDPVLYVSSLELDTPSACCHVKHGELRFLCPVSGDSA